MATQGRKSEEKAWDTGFRHVFSTNYLKDPDLHIFLFISEAEVNQIMRDALRDYMVKHPSKALDPEFQARVFMEASRQVSRGVRPVAREVMIELGEPVDKSAKAKARVPAAHPKQSPAPVRPMDPPAVAAPSSVAQVAAEVPTPIAPAPAAAAEMPQAEKAAKPRVVLDFGPELTMENGQPTTEAAKPSQRDKWLRPHNY